MNLTETLSVLRKGRMVEEASEALQETVKACIATGKKGKVTITLTISPTGDTVVIKDAVKPTVPVKENLGSTLYADEDGNLTRDNPKQAEFQEVVAPAFKKAANDR